MIFIKTYNFFSTINDIKGILLLAHPVGSYYWSSSDTNPTDLFGGTWTQVTGKFILSAGDGYVVGSTGGEKEHILSIQEMPAHGHSVSAGRTTVTTTGQGTQWSGYLNDIYNDKGTVTLNSTQSGGGLAHNNMPPYEVSYCWKRTA